MGGEVGSAGLRRMPYKGERTEVHGREEFKFSFRVMATEETAAESPRLIQDLGQG